MNPYQPQLYSKQFIFCNKEITDLENWKHFCINDYNLYTHPSLNISYVRSYDKELYLLGSLFDYSDKYATNETIIEKLIQVVSFRSLLRKVENYCGRYVLIFKRGKSVKMFNDVSAKRKVVYYFNGKDFCCASQAKFIAKYYGVQKSEKPEVLDYYKSHKYYTHNKVGVLENTEYTSVKQLMANWYLNIDKQFAVRFWPYRQLKNVSLNEAVDKVSAMLKGFMDNIHAREDMMMAVTGGNDSRLLLAASRDISNDILYYVYHLPHMQDENHPDLRLHKQIMKELGLKENIIKVTPEVDPEFSKIYKQNNEYAELANEPIISNFLSKECKGKLNISTSMSDVSRNFFSTYKNNVTSELLTKMLDYEGIPYIEKQYKAWLSDLQPIADILNYNILDLFNWEERMSNWSAYYVRDSDMATDEVSPLACRALMEIMLSVPKKLRDIHTNVLHRSIIKNLWPELANIPYNPTLSKRVSYTLKKAKVYWAVRGLVRGW